jgi:hypothetical protein
VVLQVGVFRPGLYVVEDYVVEWAALEGGGSSSGGSGSRVPGSGGAGAASARQQQQRRRPAQGSKVGEAAVLRVEAV